MKKMLAVAWAKLTGGRAVWLLDFDDDFAVSVARVSPFGHMYAYRHWPMRCGLRVTLKKGGTCSGESYVVGWKFVE